MIIKVQRPLFPIGGTWLLYNKEQTMYIMLEQSEVPKAIQQEMIDTHKAYFDIDLMLIRKTPPSKGGLIKRVEDQDW